MNVPFDDSFSEVILTRTIGVTSGMVRKFLMYCNRPFYYSAILITTLPKKRNSVGLCRVVTASFCFNCFSCFSAFGQSHGPARVAEAGIPIVFEPASNQTSGPVMTGRLHGATVAWEPGKFRLSCSAAGLAGLKSVL